ncbi:hypothetical protein [Jiulongibacter sediminis]|uniref:hypothetical protein n=1 Tax=Jiulongibacter sediminis TaxID=1605367 RepID=UPI0026E9B39E|nr:hypothetical protein [Jiulongibacter sediminis]
MTSKEILEDLRQSFLREQKALGIHTALDSLLRTFELSHPNFEGFIFRPPDTKNLVLTTEGKFGIYEKQQVRVPENILDFPLSYTIHLLFHEFMHIRQRAKPNFSASRPLREFEAYFAGLFSPNRPVIPLSEHLREQFLAAIEKYYQQMTEEEKATVQDKYDLAQKRWPESGDPRFLT